LKRPFCCFDSQQKERFIGSGLIGYQWGAALFKGQSIAYLAGRFLARRSK
jgi:hypothetical protein